MPLTQALSELVDTIGMQPTVILVRYYGARALYIPKTMPDTHPVCLRIGYEPAQKLSQLYGGMQLWVPPELSMLVELRDREIVRRVIEQGESVGATAYAFGVSRRWVLRTLARAGHHDREHGAGRRERWEDPRQLRLWD